jgi:hypothetical protein
MTQTEARQEAKRLNESDELPKGLAAIATANPMGSWGGREREWVVTLVGVKP